MSELIVLPDTALVKEALSFVRPTLSPSILNHCVRTFLLGRAYARKRRLEIDEEGFYVAALFHDLGLFPPYQADPVSFQLNSSRAMRPFLEAHGVPRERINPLVDAIDFHMQLFPRWSRGNVAGALQVGAWIDVTHLRRWWIWPESKVIAAAWPRLGLDLEFPMRLVPTLAGFHRCTGLFFPARYRLEG